jgi:hypothetical protein
VRDPHGGGAHAARQLPRTATGSAVLRQKPGGGALKGGSVITLRELRLRNVAIVERLDLEFPGGLIALTGETGAGKSIIVGLGLALGEKSRPSTSASRVRRAWSRRCHGASAGVERVSRRPAAWRKAAAAARESRRAAGRSRTRRSAADP